MKKRFWALFLAVMMVVSVLPTSVFAEGEAASTGITGLTTTPLKYEFGETDDSATADDITLSKSAVYNEEDGTFTVTLSAEAQSIVTPVTTKVVFVLDASGSMRWCTKKHYYEGTSTEKEDWDSYVGEHPETYCGDTGNRCYETSEDYRTNGSMNDRYDYRSYDEDNLELFHDEDSRWQIAINAIHGDDGMTESLNEKSITDISYVAFNNDNYHPVITGANGYNSITSSLGTQTSTYLGNGVREGLDLFENSSATNKVLIIVGDGDASGDDYAASDLNTFKNNGGIVYAIGFATNPEDAFKNMASTVNGTRYYYTAGTEGALNTVLGQIEENIVGLITDPMGSGVTLASDVDITVSGGADAPDAVIDGSTINWTNPNGLSDKVTLTYTVELKNSVKTAGSKEIPLNGAAKLNYAYDGENYSIDFPVPTANFDAATLDVEYRLNSVNGTRVDYTDTEWIILNGSNGFETALPSIGEKIDDDDYEDYSVSAIVITADDDEIDEIPAPNDLEAKAYKVVAVLTEAPETYTVTWKSQDGQTTYETDDPVAYGAQPSFEAAAPTKAADTQYTYTFAGWATQPNQENGTAEASLPTVDGNEVYYAAFSKTNNTYTVTWKTQDGTQTLEFDPSVAYGANPSYDGATPSKAADAQYTYTFVGWATQPNQESGVAASALPTVDGNEVYYAAFSKTTNNYTVTWKTQDGESTYETDPSVAYGANPSYDATEPTKDADAQYTYTFAGWATQPNQESGTAEASLPTVDGNEVYYAAFSKTANEYNITYVLDGGTNAATNPDEYTYGVGVAGFADATKSGFLFKGWFAEDTFTTPVISIGDTETGNKTLYAKWEEENKDLGIEKDVTSITAPVVEGDVLPTAEEAKTTAKVGDTITWTITVENKGNVAQTVTLEDILPNAAGTVTVTDASGAEITNEIALAAKETKTFTATYVVQIADAGKELINKAIVTGPAGSTEDPAPGVTVEPAVIVDKKVDKTSAKVGDTLTYTIDVTNNSSIALENVVVSDVKLNKTETIDVLAVGETKTFTYTYKVQTADAGQTLLNTAIAKIGNDTVGDDSAETKVDPYSPPITPVGPSKPALNYEDHINYIIGYEDGTVRPLATITRAEVATIFFRLLDDESRENFWSKENPFPDVTIDMWCNNAISTMFNAGIITGYPDGTFGPYDPVSRAEFATIAARFSEVKDTDGETNFLDLSKSYWAYSYIELAEELGWVQGYQGYFRPEDDMTRAEVMTTVNRVLKRAVEEDGMLEGMIEWPDNLPTDWFYEDVQEATNSHTYYRTDKRVKDVGTYQPNYYYEKWSELIENPDWAALERAWSDANDK